MYRTEQRTKDSQDSSEVEKVGEIYLPRDQELSALLTRQWFWHGANPENKPHACKSLIYDKACNVHQW